MMMMVILNYSRYIELMMMISNYPGHMMMMIPTIIYKYRHMSVYIVYQLSQLGDAESTLKSELLDIAWGQRWCAIVKQTNNNINNNNQNKKHLMFLILINKIHRKHIDDFQTHDHHQHTCKCSSILYSFTKNSSLFLVLSLALFETTAASFAWPL